MLEFHAVAAKGRIPPRRRPLWEDTYSCQVAIGDSDLTGIEKGPWQTDVIWSLLVIEKNLFINVAEGPQWGVCNPHYTASADETVQTVNLIQSPITFLVLL